MQPRTFDFAILALGICAVSTAAVLIREADAPFIVIAAYRTGLASIPLLGLAVARRELPLRDRGVVLITCLSGVLIALHFAFWIASVKETSVVTSVALVASQPLFVALLSGPVLKEWPPRTIWLGIALATFGGGVMVAEDIGDGTDTLRGDMLAILGAIFAAGYILTGRVARTRGIAWQPYVTIAYSVAALLLIAAAVVSGESFGGFSNHTYLMLLLLALVPQLIGHTSLNRSLGYLPAVTVAIAILGEPVGATILATTVLGEAPSVVEGLGGLLLLAGVYLGVRASVRARTDVGVDLDG